MKTYTYERGAIPDSTASAMRIGAANGEVRNASRVAESLHDRLDGEPTTYSRSFLSASVKMLREHIANAAAILDNAYARIGENPADNYLFLVTDGEDSAASAAS